MSDHYKIEIRQSNGEMATFYMRYSQPNDPVYQKGALVYSECPHIMESMKRFHVPKYSYKRMVIDRLESEIAGIPCVGIEFHTLNDVVYGNGESYYEPVPLFDGMPDGIKWIDDRTFFERVAGINLPESIEYLGDECFAYTEMENIILPSNIKHLGIGCFMDSKLKEIVIPGTLRDIPDWCFSGSELNKIYINEGVRRIGKYALNSRNWYRDDKRIVVLPRSLSFIDNDALGGDSYKGIIYTYPGSYAFFWAKGQHYNVEMI